MKKLLSLVAIAATFSLVACGPSKEEQEKAEKMKMDSIAAVATADSLANEAAMKATADSLAAVAQAKATADSLAAAAAKPRAKKK